MPDSYRPPNARREPRIETTVQVSFLRGRKTHPAQTGDVSFKGLSIQMANPPELRSLMRLRITLPTREIEVHAMAVHHSPCEEDPSLTTVGVQFWGFAGQERSQWDDFVRELVQEARVTRSRPEVDEDDDFSVEETLIASGVRISPTSTMPQAAGDD
jgi:hypothetical protein